MSKVASRFEFKARKQNRTFAERIALIASGCWLWLGPVTTNGYGRLGVNGRRVQAHRYAYETWRGAVPEGQVLDHVCRNRRCVNPDHLRPIGAVENVMIGESIPARNARKTHCKNGHPFSAENTRTHTKRDGSKQRVCRACSREWMKTYRAESLARI